MVEVQKFGPYFGCYILTKRVFVNWVKKTIAQKKKSLIDIYGGMPTSALVQTRIITMMKPPI